MDSQWSKIRTLAVFCLSWGFIFYSLPCLAGEIDWDVFGLTYHLHRKGAVYNAPLKLDHHGVKVFNPGIGLGYDFRQDRHTQGFSAIVHGGVFENCDNHPYSFVGAGARYRKFFYKNNFFEINAMGVLTYGNSSDKKHYELSPTPYANLGFGHDYGKFLVTWYVSYIPKGSDGGITSDTDMVFFSTAVSF